jgi:Leucine-rich repeat (LRR) protein
VYENAFTGTIPASFGRLGALNVLAVHSNELTSSLPVELGNLTSLKYLYVSDNRLTGTIPPDFYNLTKLRLLEADGNHLTGTMPYFLGNFTALGFIVLHDNAFSGSLPRSLSNLTQLQELQVQNNHLSGTLDGVFDWRMQHQLSVIQVENNQLTGSLPAEVFALTGLLTFAAVSNCLQGTLPAQACNSSQLEALVLDGVSSAKACRSALLPGVSSSYSTTKTLHGTLPPCLFQLPSLTTLHLSGNGFTGQIPDIEPSASLLDLTLSHNLLTGSIPAPFQRRQWLELDLSYNRLSGTLLSTFASELLNFTALVARERSLGISVNISQLEDVPALSLESNHLSGRIPSAILQVKNVSVLGTNVFSCDLDRSDLPQHDGDRSNYQCGSDSFEVPYYLWLGLAGMVAAAGAIAALSGTSAGSWLSGLRSRILKWTAAEDKRSRTGAYLTKLRALAHVAAAVMAFSLAVLLPLYSVLSHYYGTVTHAYAWVVSAAYLSGTVPAAWEFAIWAILLGAFLTVFLRLALERGEVRRAAVEGIAAQEVSGWAAVQSAAVYVSFVSINLVVVFGVNAAFVYVAIYRSSALLVGAQVLVSLFKIAWNNNCSTFILHTLVRWIRRGDSTRLGSEFASLQVFVALLNNIVIPCLVVAVVSPDCFYVVFDAAPAITSQFSFRSCILDDNFVCQNYNFAESSTSYNPPFRYSYQCSSSFITYYAPAYVILCLVLTFGYPALQLTVVLGHQSLRPGSRTYSAMGALLPGMLKPIAAADGGKGAQSGHSEQPAVRSRIGANRMVTVVLTFLGLLMTFGAAFPPLAVALAGTAAVSAYGTAVKVDRLLFLATAAGRADIVRDVEAECARAGGPRVLWNSVWMLLGTSALFYTLFLFDTLGSAVGFEGALWVLVAMPMLPAVLYILCMIYCARASPAAEQRKGAGAPSQEADVELSVMHEKSAGPEEDVYNVIQS